MTLTHKVSLSTVRHNATNSSWEHAPKSARTESYQMANDGTRDSGTVYGEADIFS